MSSSFEAFQHIEKDKKTEDNCSANNCHVENLQNSNFSSVTGTVPESLIGNTGNAKLLEERLKRYEDERDQISTITNVENAMSVDLCFVLDCTLSMIGYIRAARKHILKVANYVNNNNSNIKFWIGFCGYRDHNDRNRLQIFDFTNSLEKFESYISNKVCAQGGGDIPEDVLGGLNAAITTMTWSNATRILIHIGDAPPHGRRFSNIRGDRYPNGDPNGLTAESVLKEMQSKNILYHFGKINNSTEIMLGIFREIIGEFPVFDLKTTGMNPSTLVDKFCKATCSAIFSSVTLTTTLRNSKKKTGEILCYIPPKSLAEIQDDLYFINSNFTVQNISFKLAPQPFSV
ncbi:24614_t:CDS:2, partial [Racocetra persica]